MRVFWRGSKHLVETGVKAASREADVLVVNQAALRRWHDLVSAGQPVSSLFNISCSGTRQSTPRAIRRTLSKEIFVRGRGLLDYYKHLGPEFFEDVCRLGPQHHWFDSGAGAACAPLSYFNVISEPMPTILEEPAIPIREIVELIKRPNRIKGNVTAVSLKPVWETCTATLRKAQFRFLVGRFFQDIPLKEIGSCNLITDLAGPFIYSHNPDLVLARYLSILKPGGKLYIYVGHFNTGIIDSGQIIRGEESFSLFDWLRMIEGITFDSQLMPRGETFIIQRKRTGMVLIPHLRYLYQESIKNGCPRKAFELV